MTNQQKCPPAENLQALIAGTLTADDEAAVAGHLANCETCQSQIETIAAPAEFKANVANWLSGSAEHSDSLSTIIAKAEADIRESSRELTMGQPTVSVTSNSLEDSVLGGDARQKRGYADVEKWLEADDHPAAIGRLGQFRLTEFIGRGGMGAVFKADDLKLQREVALKVLSPELASNEGACERFLREARAIAAINHDNIVTIHAVGEDAALPYFVMEYVHGHSPWNMSTVIRCRSTWIVEANSRTARRPESRGMLPKGWRQLMRKELFIAISSPRIFLSRKIRSVQN